jgi:CRISPR-associated protein Csx10
MKRLDLTLTTHAPLSLGRHKSGSISETEQYIPGTSIRGAIASYLLHQTGHHHSDLSSEGGDFQRLFLDAEAAIFHNAYPAIAKVNDHQSQFVSEPVGVLPATAVSSKNNPGFKQEQAAKGGVFDTLIDRFCAEQVGYLYDPSCPQDQSRVEPFGGFYSKGTTHYRSHTVSTRFLTRVGINRRRATAQDGLLYSTEVLNESFLVDAHADLLDWEPVVYRGSIIVFDDSLADQLMLLINQYSDAFRIGSSTSRGLGKISLKASLASESLSVGDRVNRFNQKLRDRWQRWVNLFGSEVTENRSFFTLDLQSDNILTDCWRRTTVITPTLLNQFTGASSNSELELHATYSSHDYRSGWNSALGLMKDVELITNKGTVYLFSVPIDQLDDWVPKLEQLEVTGVGDRTSEGFGQVQVCNEFHLVFREEAV